MRYTSLPLVLLFMTTITRAQLHPLPASPREARVDTIHGIPIADPYRWLEDDHDPKVMQWVAMQRERTETYLATIPFRNALRARLAQLYDYTKFSMPNRHKDLTFFRKQTGTQNHSVLYMQKKGGEPVVLLDPNTWSKDGTIGLDSYDASEDNRYLSYMRTEAGSDWREIHVMDLRTKRYLGDVIKWVKASGVSWWKDGFYYSRYDAPVAGTSELSGVNRGQKIYYHTVGTKQEDDKLVYEDPNEPLQFNGCWVPEESNLLLRWASKGSERGSRIFVRHADKPQEAWHTLFSSTDDQLNIVGVHRDVVYGATTQGAPRGRIVRFTGPLDALKMETVVEQGEHPIVGIGMAGGKLFVIRMIDVHHEVTIYDLNGKRTGTVTLPGLGTVGGFGGRHDDTTIFYSYTSYTYPTTTFEYDLRTGTSKVWKKAEAQFDPGQFTARQVFVTSKDGTRVPMFLLHRKDFVADGTAPTVLYGYGGFNISQTPAFNPLLVAWLEQGGVYAIANLRGGGEYGEPWHDAGTKLKKQNVFDDAIACAQWLIDQRITTTPRLAINGRSNGGLLVGALMTQRPDLFGVAVPEVGVLDMLRYHLFTIGWNWASDYGTVADEKEFKALLAYSPLHNLRPNVEYPATMVMTADHDDRVVPAHSFKFAAMLQHVYGGQRPMLMRVETKSGHGAVNVSTMLDGMADKFAFMWQQMGFVPRYQNR